MIKKLVLINILVFISLMLSIETISRLFISKDSVNKFLFDDEDLRVRGRPFIKKNNVTGFSLVPSFKNDYYIINSLGFRGDDFPDNIDKKYVILTMGESTTFGWGVKNNETYPFYLMSKMKALREDAYVINGGIPSYTSSQVSAYLEEILENSNLQPDMILLNIMWNDIWYSTIKNWHPDILIYQKTPYWISFLMNNSYFFYFLMKSIQKNDQDKDRFNKDAFQEYKENLKKLIELAKEHDVRIALVEAPFDSVHMPSDGLKEFQIHYTKDFFIETAKKYNEAASKIASEKGILFIEHRLGMKNIYQEELFLDPLHPRPLGNKMIAEDIFRFLSINNYY